jgi:hypothetical protein
MTANKRPASSTSTNSTKKKKLLIKDTPHVLLWIPHNGLGQKKTWSGLKAMGVFSTKADAEAERIRIMSRHDRCGHGDIMVGGTWEDEIDLVVKPCESFLEKVVPETESVSASSSTNIIIVD